MRYVYKPTAVVSADLAKAFGIQSIVALAL
jgi:hypothetical protein